MSGSKIHNGSLDVWNHDLTTSIWRIIPHSIVFSDIVTFGMQLILARITVRAAGKEAAA